MYPLQADIKVVVPQFVPRLDIGGIYTLATTGKASAEAETVVPTSGSARSTVTSPNTTTGTAKVPVVDNKGTQTVGSDITNQTAAGETSAYTEHLVYFNKCAGIFRLLGVKSTAGTAQANSDAAAPAAAKATK